MQQVDIFVSAGELSGDRLAAGVIRQLPPGLRVAGIGGPALAGAGMELLLDITATAAVGISEALRGLFPALSALSRARRLLRRLQPRLLLLVDCQGFNLPLAAGAKRLGIRTVYLIPPQNFLWNDRRMAAKLAVRVDYLLHIYRRSEQFYSEAGIPGEFIGHPLLDLQPVVERAPQKPPRYLLLPGSRRHELRRHLPLFAAAALELRRRSGDCTVVFAAADRRAYDEIERFVKKKGLSVQIIRAASWPVVEAGRCCAALCKSGTAVLQCALAGLPAVAVYRLSKISWFVLRRLLRLHKKIPFVTLPNLLTGRRLVPELLQQEAQPEKLAAELLALDEAQLQSGFDELHRQAGTPGGCRRAAEALCRLLEDDF